MSTRSRLGVSLGVIVLAGCASPTVTEIPNLGRVATLAEEAGWDVSIPPDGAGLPAGRRATTHWAYTDLLPLVGATHEPGRVVTDGSTITAGGVTSGIDFGLTVVAEVAGETTAKSIQLSIEYDPAPPFDAGHPDRAPQAAKEALTGRYEKSRQAYRTSMERLSTQ